MRDLQEYVLTFNFFYLSKSLELMYCITRRYFRDVFGL